MSVYKPKGSKIYVYDFQWRGNRFSGSTGSKSEREAQQVENARKDTVKKHAEVKKRSDDAPMTLDIACDRYWTEVGLHVKEPRGLEWSIDYLLDFFGKDKPIAEITDDEVASLVAKRRGERVTNYMVLKNKTKKPGKLVSAATVNRSVTEPLRRIMIRARNRWKKEIGLVDWAQHRLKEPKERVRSMSTDEQRRLFAVLPSAYHPIVHFALRTGFRAMECINLRWSDIDWGDRRIRVKGKGDKDASIPMPIDVRDILFPLQRPKVEHVFMMPGGAGRMTYRAFYSAFLTATKKAGISGLRIHDLRHTAATRLLRKTGNLKLAKDLLRHEDISTTAKYAHTLDQELRDALDSMALPEIPCPAPVIETKALKENEK